MVRGSSFLRPTARTLICCGEMVSPTMIGPAVRFHAPIIADAGTGIGGGIIRPIGIGGGGAAIGGAGIMAEAGITAEAGGHGIGSPATHIRGGLAIIGGLAITRGGQAGIGIGCAITRG